MTDNEQGNAARAYFDLAVACPNCTVHPHPIVTIEEAAFLIGVSRRTLFRWLAGSAAYSEKKIVTWLVENGGHVQDLVTDKVAHVGETIT